MVSSQVSAILLSGVVLGGMVPSCSRDDGAKAEARPKPGADSADARFRHMLDVEKTIGMLTPLLGKVSGAVKNLRLPDHEAAPLFLPDATAVDLSGPIEEAAAPVDAALPVKSWRFGLAEKPVRVEELEGGIWKALWGVADYFGKVKFGVVRGEVLPDGGFRMELAFSARGGASGGGVVALGGKVECDWAKDGETWKIRHWNTLAMTCQQAEKPLFREVLRQAIPDAGDYALARRSVHHQYIRDVLMTGRTTFHYPKEYWLYVVSWDSLDQHPSVAVVDIDGDGWDDFYVTGRWGRNQLWRNRGDGTFEEKAAAWGIDVDGMCNCALFADFDNDGDPDLFLGRSLERGRYFVNEGTRFTDATETALETPLPFWTSSLAAADYNGDGLLDLYVSTYRLPITKPKDVLAKEFLSPEERTEWQRRRAEDHPVFRLTGPPNVLLVNKGGGRFAPAPEGKALELWLSSFQSTWSDFDNDGDPDLFVANDYAPDFVFRNDAAPEGTGRVFVDVSHAMAGDELRGFGMGVTLGDYDNDGLQDPFFTYMFSKAGSRITAMFKGLEKRMYEGARGNKLLRNEGGRFRLVSGTEEGALGVTKTGWSWGGQFSDFDNDGFLDLYVSNGYYSPPDEAATEVDL